MKRTATAIALTATMALGACTEGGYLNRDEAIAAGIGAGFGTITAKALGANTEWTIIGALAGAAAGTLVARNQAANECAYARGDGTYYTAPCP
ncbi:glucose-6-phosphate isomerase [Psychromarinibacter sp. C21-152]|uniref:Glucose-6-phosphate isomerase n=1 Tax=Psychromarinibacter sediminicola TaxID=3033385 RepID=A0AAE3NP76_9RHOB|nr:glucose-6-phosphate isomerase [Psychromarinibacter sediminicola]MDF0599576.1 glucose-6-phosphate isomerase [Psychromarinibacter sediminicola]